MNDELLFHQALERPAGERAPFLDQACAGDEAQRQRVEALLQAHDNPGSFLQAPAVQLPATTDSDPQAAANVADHEPAPREEAGRLIGPYRLLQQLGEGGFGIVFLAEQQQPVRRQVALKLIKAGMDSRHVIARFEAERQALALMDHPNIARVFDAGETPDGRPYFVMELVRGIPITQFCDEHLLPPRARLELFATVCQAVQHAHQKGIIHRDIKPSNVLVTLQDDKPVVKVIDFGIAKATGPQLTDKTLFTNIDQVVGTPLYMSPEQAGLSGLDIDTRSDIYSLGVLLYELLTGTTPFDRARLKQAAFEEIRRIIREEEPPRPSTRLSGSASLPSVAAQRQTDPKRLRQMFQGEVDWLVMKALEKDRNRRYETANGLAADVLRYLADEPVQACPPSAWYRFRKFSRRNKVAFTTGALVAAALVLGTAVSLWQAVRASDALEAKLWEEARANKARADERLTQIALDQEQIEKERQKARVEHEQARVNRDLAAALVEATRLQGRAKAGDLEAKRAWTNLRETAKRAEALAGSELADAVLLQRVQALLAHVNQDDRERRMVAQLEEIRLNPDPDNLFGAALEFGAKYVKRDHPYLAAFQEFGLPVLDMQVEDAAHKIAASSIRDSLVIALDDWAYHTRDTRLLTIAQKVYDDPWRQKYFDARLRYDRAALTLLARQPEAAKHPELLTHLLRIAGGRDSIQLMLDAQARHPGDYWLNSHFGRNPQMLRYPGENIGFLRAALALRPESSALYYSLGVHLNAMGRDDDAITMLEHCIRLRPDHPWAHADLSVIRGVALEKKGKSDEAFAAYKEALRLRPQHHGAYLCIFHALERKEAPVKAYLEYLPGYKRASRNAPAQYIALGDMLAKCNQAADAIEAYRRGIRFELCSPASPYYEDKLYQFLIKSGRLDQTIALWRKDLERPPTPRGASTNHARELYSIAVVLEKSGRLDEAIATWEHAVRQLEIETGDGGKFAIWARFGDTLAKAEKLDRAAAAYRKALELGPSFRTAQEGLLKVLVQTNQLEEAIKVGWELAREAGNVRASANAYEQLFALVDKAGRPQEAVAIYREAVRILPTKDVHAMAARFADKKRFAVAIVIYREALRLYPNYRGICLPLAQALESQGRLDEAIAVLRGARRMGPELPAVVQAALKGDLARKGKAADILAVYRAAQGTLGGLGDALAKIGLVDEAMAAWQEAVRLEPTYLWGYRRLASAHEKKGRPDKASAVLRDALRAWPDLPPFLQPLLKEDFARNARPADVLAVYWGSTACLPKIVTNYPNLAQRMTDMGLLNEAAPVWQEVVRLDPKNVSAQDRLSLVLEKKGRFLEARAVLSAALGVWPDLPPVLQAMLKEDFAKEAKPADVLAVYRMALSSQPNNFNNFTLLGDALARMGLVDEAMAAWQETVRLSPRNTYAYLQLAQAQEKKGLVQDAIASCRKVIELQPGITTTYPQLVSLLIRAGKLDDIICLRSDASWPQQACDLLQTRGLLEKGIVACREGIGKRPDEACFRAVLGLALERQVKLKEALAVYAEWIRLAPKSGEALVRRGILYQRMGQSEPALVDYSKATDVAPAYAPAWQHRANYFAGLAQWDKAAADFSKLIVLNPKDDAAWHGRSNAYSQLKQWDMVAADSTQRIALNPNFYTPWFMRGVAFNNLGQYEKSVADNSRAIELFLNYAPAWHNRALALEGLGHWEKAAADYARAQQLGYAAPSVVTGWARCQSRLGRYQEALTKLKKAIPSMEVLTELAWQLATCPEAKFRDARRAVELAGRFTKAYPSEGAHWTTLGAAHYRAGDWKAAVEALTKSMKLRQGGDSRDGFFLAMAQQKLGNRVEARKQFDRAVEWLDKHRPNDPELRGFRAEAAAVLGLEQDGQGKKGKN